MKVLMKPVEMIAWFTIDGIPNPIKYRFPNDTMQNMTISVNRIVCREEEKLAGNKMYIFRCQSVINGVEKVYELRYELNSCKWYLAKI